MFSDPLSVTYNGSSKSLPKIGTTRNYNRYKTADGEFEVYISNNPDSRTGILTVSVKLIRNIPDPTPSDPFDPFRSEANAFSIGYSTDLATHNQASTDHPLLRSALLALVDSTFYGRLISGER